MRRSDRAGAAAGVCLRRMLRHIAGRATWAVHAARLHLVSRASETTGPEPKQHQLSVPFRRGFADSKTLNEEKRERLYEAIQAQGGLLGYEADVLSAAVISGALGGRDAIFGGDGGFEFDLTMLRCCM